MSKLECTCHECCYARKHPQLGPAPHAILERDRYLCVVALSEEAAKALAMPDAVKVVNAGQADPTRHRFGARVYFLFQTWDDYQAWLREKTSP